MQPNNIFFHEINIRSSLLHKKDLKKFLLSIFKKEGIEVKEIDIIFCTDEYLLSLNIGFLNHNYYTDTLSFILSNPEDPVIGDIYISIDRIRSNARDFKISYQNELCRVIIHSCLHLCGYSDKPKKASIKMEALQEIYLNEFNVSRETQIGG
ncbi:MAG TPA: rRNA maturation RNase YbeY [Chitinophagaceae bacterium]